MDRRFFNVNTGNAIKFFYSGGLQLTRVVPEKHVINFFGLDELKDLKIKECVGSKPHSGSIL